VLLLLGKDNYTYNTDSLSSCQGYKTAITNHSKIEITKYGIRTMEMKLKLFSTLRRVNPEKNELLQQPVAFYNDFLVFGPAVCMMVLE
jgi:hypothetical protein